MVYRGGLTHHGSALVPHAGRQHREEGSSAQEPHAPGQGLPQIKPGSAGKPMPGFDLHVVDDRGSEVEAGSMRNIVVGFASGADSVSDAMGGRGQILYELPHEV